MTLPDGPVLYLLDSYVELSQTFVREEIRELRRQGVDVRVVALSPGDTQPDPDEPVDYLTRSYRGDRRLAAAWARRAVRSPARVATAVRTLATYRDESVPWRPLAALADDVERWGVVWIHAHFGWLAAATASVVADLTGRPWSMTLHARDIFVDARDLRAKLDRADHLVSVCRYNLDWMREHVGDLPPTTIVVCGTALPAVPPPPPPGGHRVVAVGRLVPKKGIDVLLDAVPHVRAAVPGLEVEIVGDGPARGELEAQARRLGVGDVVRFVGARAHEDTLAHIAAGDVFCFPARIAEDGDRDSMPVVIKEAMARAVPVVASDLVAIPEMVDDRVGVLVPPEDPDALADALVALLTDPERAARLGAAGRDRVAEVFTLETQVRRLVGVFAGGGRA